MFERLKNLFSSDAPSLPEADVRPARGGAASVVDTAAGAGEGVVTNILEVRTDGEKTTGRQAGQLFLARRSIFDRAHEVVGYELVMGHDVVPVSRDPGVCRLADELMLQCIVDLPSRNLLGEPQVFIVISEATLDSPLLDALPSRGVVLAVRLLQEDIARCIKRFQELAAKGFQLALEDIRFAPELLPLLPHVQFVRFRATRFDAIDLGKQVVALLKGASPKLMATGIESEEEDAVCRKLSFNYYQGGYYARTRPPLSQRVDNDRVHVMDMLNKVMGRAEISVLEEGFKHDAMLSYKLLRFINSAGSGVGQEIRSIAHALLILGYEQLYRWLTLLLFTSGEVDEYARGVLKNAMVRARMTEELGRSTLAPPQNDGLFIVGIFSLLDVLLNMPIQRALEHLSLPDSVSQALLRREGLYAPYLELAIACEQEDQSRIEALAATCGVDAATVNQVQIEAMGWAERMSR